MEELAQKQQQPGMTQQQLEQQKQREQGQATQEAQKRERNLRSWIVCRSRSERGAFSVGAGTGPVPSTAMMYPVKNVIVIPFNELLMMQHTEILEERELVQQQQQPDGVTQEQLEHQKQSEQYVLLELCGVKTCVLYNSPYTCLQWI